MSLTPLPIDPLLPEIVASLRAHPTLVLEAPPGAGKTTRVPRALLDAGFAGDGGRSGPGDIVVLEPRRLAARMAARRVAEELGEAPGGTIGYHVRFEEAAGPRTRVRFVTEGILGRRLVTSPSLDGVSTVVLDEFHERHLHADVALALLERLRRARRPDLRVVVMSATLAAGPIAAYLGAPVLRAEGRRFDVAVDHLPAPDDRPLASQVASAVRRLVSEGLDGDVLVFLPGAGEIRRALESCEKVAAEADLLLVPLHGDLSPKEQDVAVRPASRRKVILSTNVAESSVTIDGVVAVVDGGLARVASQAPWSGLPRLRLDKISRASAVQRTGRAGRTRPGRCLRLYTRADFEGRPEHDTPEIRRLDLAQVALDLAALEANDVPWLDPPPPANLDAATTLLLRLGAIDAPGRITPTGRAMLRFAVHPRVARVVVEGERRGVAAAVLTEGDLRASSKARFGDRRATDRATERSDVVALVDLFREAEDSRFSPGALRAAELDARATLAVARAAAQLERACSAKVAAPANTEAALRLSLLAGYPDRVARRARPGSRSLALAEGRSAELAETSVVRDAEWLVALEAEEGRAGARSGAIVRLASAIEPDWLLDLFADGVTEKREVAWNAKADWIARARFAASVDATLHTPDDAAVVKALTSLCEGLCSFAELREAGLLDALRASVGRAADVDRLAPERVVLAGGRAVAVAYAAGKPPSIASRLQDFFGMKDGPRVGGGRVPLVLELLAPNQRAVQVTTDLAGFWERHYPGIRRELMRKYPRHSWPDDPTKPAPRMRPRTS